MNDYYKILGVEPTDSDEVIQLKFQELKNKYLEERFSEGEVGNIAAQKLTELEKAYKEICTIRSERRENTSGQSKFDEIEVAIKNGNLELAQKLLDEFDERNGEWHYYMSVVFYKKNYFNESKKQLEIALQIEPDNKKYKDALNKMNERFKTNTESINANWNQSGNAQHTHETSSRQMGGNACLEWCCDMIICNTILNCCCGGCR